MLPLVRWCDCTCTCTVLSHVAAALVLVLSHCSVETDTVLNVHTLFWWAGFTISDLLFCVRVDWLWYFMKSGVENSVYWFMAVQVGTERQCTCLLWSYNILIVEPCHCVLLSHGYYKKSCKIKRKICWCHYQFLGHYTYQFLGHYTYHCLVFHLGDENLDSNICSNVCLLLQSVSILLLDYTVS